MPDLRTRYLGLELRSPIVASAGPFTGERATARLIDEAGAGAIVMPSLFEEEILREELQLNEALEAGSEGFAEALDYFPAIDSFVPAGDRYLFTLEQIKRQSSVPVMASLNATSAGGWVRYAKLMESAGADAIELNLYHVAADPDRSAEQMEATDLQLVAEVSNAIGIPLAVKLSPYYSAMANFARRAAGAGAAGLVLFNRFYQPDLDVDSREVVARLQLSQPWELRLPLRWIAILRPQLGAATSLAATSGIHSGEDVVKALMVGADVAMMTSAILHDGPDHIATVEAELRAWMDLNEYTSVDELRGCASQATSDDPSAFERANYVKALHSWATPQQRIPAAPGVDPATALSERSEL